MTKKIMMMVLMTVLIPYVQASKLSNYLNRTANEQRLREEQEWRDDMNFADMSFRLENRYIDNQGQRCRDYQFRSRTNPFRHGQYTVCDER